MAKIRTSTKTKAKPKLRPLPKGFKLPKQEKPAKLKRVLQPSTGKAVKQRSEFIRWAEKERVRLAGFTDRKVFDREYELFEKEAEKRSAKLLGVFNKAWKQRERRQYGEFQMVFKKPALLDSRQYFGTATPTYCQSYELYPWKKTVYQSSTGDLVERPDDEHWRVRYRDAETTLSIQYRYWLPQRGMLFTGHFAVHPRIMVSGLVDIKSGGKVTICADTGVGLRRCEHSNTNHDAGFHYDPAFDTDHGCWQSRCQNPGNMCFTDTTYGPHAFGPEVDVIASAEGMADPGSGYFLDLYQYITITAENAWVHFEFNNVGTIYTPHPMLTLEYFD